MITHGILIVVSKSGKLGVHSFVYVCLSGFKLALFKFRSDALVPPTNAPTWATFAAEYSNVAPFILGLRHTGDTLARAREPQTQKC